MSSSSEYSRTGINQKKQDVDCIVEHVAENHEEIELIDILIHFIYDKSTALPNDFHKCVELLKIADMWLVTTEIKTLITEEISHFPAHHFSLKASGLKDITTIIKCCGMLSIEQYTMCSNVWILGIYTWIIMY